MKVLDTVKGLISKDKIKEIFTKDRLEVILQSPWFKYFILFFTSLFYWEILLFIVTGGLKLSCLYFLLFLPSEAVFLATINGFFKNLINRIVTPILLAIPGIYYIVQLVYYRNFDSLFSISMMGMGNDAIGNFWWALQDTIVASVGWIILFLLPISAGIVIGISNWPKLESYKLKYHLFSLLAAVLLLLIGVGGARLFGTDRQSPYYLLTDATVSTDTAARKLGTLTTAVVESISYYFGVDMSQDTGFAQVDAADGFLLVEDNESDTTVTNEEIVRTPWINEAIDFNAIADATDNEELKSLDQYFATREPSKTNEYTGIFEGYNLVYICAEAFWTYACNEEVTPTLYKMANNGVVLNNYYNSLKNTTTNGEFALSTSLWPDVSRIADDGKDVGSFPRSSSIYMPQGLGDLFGADGVPSFAYHNYYGMYYRRALSWPNLGYEKCKFLGQGMQFTSHWPASDLEMMQQSVDDFINEDRFLTYYMTFSGHGPFKNSNYMYRKNINDVTAITGTERYNDEARGYLAGELELDRAMEYLLKRLEEAGKLDNTVIVIAGDHYPYYFSDTGRDSLVGRKMDEEFEIYKSTCIIYNAGLKEPIVSDTYCCNVDIEPTILNLFNIPFESRLMMGHDVFSEGVHRAALYNQSFITDMVQYNHDTGETVWFSASDSFSQDQKDNYLKNMISLVENEYMASCKMINDNYFLHVYEKAGILSAKEIEEEKIREKKVKEEGDQYNQEQLEKALEKQAEEEAAQAQEELEKQLEIWRKEVEDAQNGNQAVNPPADGGLGVPADNSVPVPDANLENPLVQMP